MDGWMDSDYQVPNAFPSRGPGGGGYSRQFRIGVCRQGS